MAFYKNAFSKNHGKIHMFTWYLSSIINLLVTLFIGCDSNKKIEKGNIEGISQNIQKL